MEYALHAAQLLPGLALAVVPSGSAGDATEHVDTSRSRTRLHQFGRGRQSGRLALQCLGVTTDAIAIGSGGEPLWPKSICGSISHTSALSAAVAAHRAAYESVGVDAHPHDMMSLSDARYLCTAAELSRLEEVELPIATRLVGLMFAAKEASLKCHYALTRRLVDLTNITVVLGRESFTASATPSGKSHGEALLATGFWRMNVCAVLAVAYLRACDS